MEQAITPQGAIDANWVLIGAFIIIGFLLVTLAGIVANHFIKALDTIREEVGHLRNDVDDLQLKEVKVDMLLDHIKHDRDETLDKIFAKLELMKSL